MKNSKIKTLFNFNGEVSTNLVEKKVNEASPSINFNNFLKYFFISCVDSNGFSTFNLSLLSELYYISQKITSFLKRHLYDKIKTKEQI